MSSEGFPTPLLRPAADPPSPPEFHLTPAALDLPALSHVADPLLAHSGSASSSFFSSSRPSSPPGDQQRQELFEQRQDMRQQYHVEDEETEMEGGAWRMKSPGSSPMFGAAVVAAASGAATTVARGEGEMSTSLLTSGRGRTPITRARSCSWARSSTSPAPNRNVPMRAFSSILPGSAHSQHFSHPYRGDAHRLPLLSSRKGIATHTPHSVSIVYEPRSTTSTATEEEPGAMPSSSAAAPAPAGHASATAAALGGPPAETEAAAGREEEDLGRQSREGLEQEVESINLPTVKTPTGPLLLGSHMVEGGDAKAAAEGPGSTAATGSKAALLPLSCEAASKLLVDAQSPSSRGSVSSMLTCSTRSSASGCGAPDDQERAVLLLMLQQQPMRQQQHPREQQLGQPPFLQREQQSLLGKEVASRATDGTRVAVTGTAESGLPLAGDSTSIACRGGAAVVQGIVALEGSKEGEGEARREGGGTMRGAVSEEEEAGVAHFSRLLPHPFIGLSPAAQRGLPEEGEAAGIFERIWADVLRREAAQQQAVPMLETARMTPTPGGEPCLLSTAPRGEQGEQHQQQNRQQQQQPERQLGGGALQQQQRLLLRAGAEQQR